MTQPKILLADDDEMIVDALRFQLEDEGFTVIVAYDGNRRSTSRARPGLICCSWT